MNKGTGINFNLYLAITLHVLANTMHWISAGLMLVQRLRRWPNIKPTLIQCVVYPSKSDPLPPVLPGVRSHRQTLSNRCPPSIIDDVVDTVCRCHHYLCTDQKTGSTLILIRTEAVIDVNRQNGQIVRWYPILPSFLFKQIPAPRMTWCDILCYTRLVHILY